MSAKYRFTALPYEPFAVLFEDEAAHRAAGAVLMTVEECPGSPCRVSLADAAVGETVVLVPFTHHDVDSPYRASGPIFVRRAAVRAEPVAGEVPRFLRHRLLSLRAYDAHGMMCDAEVVQGDAIEGVLERMFGEDGVRYVDVHNARPGCFNCRVERA